MNPPSSTVIDRLRTKYPDRVPLFLVKAEGCTIEITKRKFLVPSTLTLAEFIQSIRRLYTIAPEKALFFYINHTLPNNGELVSVLYDRHKCTDGSLHITYSEENTFG
jgi:GABA(A) receptor-associated protein